MTAEKCRTVTIILSVVVVPRVVDISSCRLVDKLCLIGHA